MITIGCIRGFPREASHIGALKRVEAFADAGWTLLRHSHSYAIPRRPELKAWLQLRLLGAPAADEDPTTRNEPENALCDAAPFIALG